MRGRHCIHDYDNDYHNDNNKNYDYGYDYFYLYKKDALQIIPKAKQQTPNLRM